MTNLAEILVDLPLFASILLKITILLLISWIVHLILVGKNPRWRILLCRCAITGLFLIPILVPFGYLQVSITPPPEPAEITKPQPVLQYPIIEIPVLPQVQSVPISESVPISKSEVFNISQPSFSLSTWLRENIYMIVLFSWASVVVISILRLLIGFIRIKKRIVSSLPGPEHLQQLLDKVTNDLGCTQKIELRYAPDMSMPFLTGLLRPIIILPERMIDEKYKSKWEAIFAHEVAHLNSRDLIWMLMTRWLEVVLWFHPLVWKLRDTHSTTCEEVSDAVAADYIGNTESYSSTLASLALEVIGKVPVIGGIPMARSSEIMQRLRILKQRIYPARLARRWIILSGLVSLIVLAAIGGLSLVYAEDSEAEKYILHFPEDRSLGTIKVRDWDKPSRQYFDWEFLNQWETFAEAKGDVIVPKDKKLALVINKEAAKDLSPLLSLEPDIFHMLYQRS